MTSDGRGGSRYRWIVKLLAMERKAALAFVGIVILHAPGGSVGQTVNIADSNLEQAIRDELNKPNGDLTQDDLNQLFFLNAPSRGITTLEGFSNASNLLVLDLNFNALSGAALTPGFPQLQRAEFRGNGLSHFAITGPLPNLNQLSLSENLITNVAFLDQTPQLAYLELDYNELSDFAAGPPLNQLVWLNLAFNRVQNLDFLTRMLQLENLYLDDNGLTNVVFPAVLTNLTWLTLDVNRISNLVFLAFVPNVTRLDLASNLARNYEFPSGLKSLAFLNLGENRLTNVVFAPDLTNLTTLLLDDNRFSEMPDLLPLFALRSLYLEVNQFTEITIPYSLTNLTLLDVGYNPLNQLIMPEVLVSNVADLVNQLTNSGVSVLTYPFPPRLLGASHSTNGFSFSLLGPPGKYEILRSTGLESWNLDGHITNLLVAIDHTNSVSTQIGAAFYRVRLQ